jgi:DNA invertase Pin-like site-specific DNA recombinase
MSCDHIFQDKISGTSVSQPALDNMLSQIREGDTVIVAKFNRLGISTTHLINLINSFFQQGYSLKR